MACQHELTWVDAGPYSDDIGYRVCKKCGVELEYPKSKEIKNLEVGDNK